MNERFPDLGQTIRSWAIPRSFRMQDSASVSNPSGERTAIRSAAFAKSETYVLPPPSRVRLWLSSPFAPKSNFNKLENYRQKFNSETSERFMGT